VGYLLVYGSHSSVIEWRLLALKKLPAISFISINMTVTRLLSHIEKM